MILPRMRELRLEAYKTQRQVAHHLQISQSTYSNYETGKVTITIDALIQLCYYYGVSMDYITGRSDERNRHA